MVNPEGKKVNSAGEDVSLGTTVDKNVPQVSQNNYHLVPNRTYIKDPTITVNKGSEESFLFIIIHNGIEDIECSVADHVNNQEHKGTIEQQLINNGWMPIQERSAGTVYVYIGDNQNTAEGVTATTKDVKVKLFESFTISFLSK